MEKKQNYAYRSLMPLLTIASMKYKENNSKIDEIKKFILPTFDLFGAFLFEYFSVILSKISLFFCRISLTNHQTVLKNAFELDQQARNPRKRAKKFEFLMKWMTKKLFSVSCLFICFVLKVLLCMQTGFGRFPTTKDCQN